MQKGKTSIVFSSVNKEEDAGFLCSFFDYIVPDKDGRGAGIDGQIRLSEQKAPKDVESAFVFEIFLYLCTPLRKIVVTGIFMPI